MQTTPLDAFSEALRRLRCGEPEAIEEALALLRTAERGFPRDRQPVEWATVQVNLGIALVQRAHGSRGANIEEALRHFDRALEVFTKEQGLGRWASVVLEKGSAYLRRPCGDLAENVERAKRCYELALRSFDERTDQDHIGGALANLGLAYFSRLRGERAANIDHAIDLYRAALEFLAGDELASKRSDVYNNLGGAYVERRSGRWQDNVEDAIDAYTRALVIPATPAASAEVQSNLGFAYWRRGLGDRRWNLQQALAAFTTAQDALADPSLAQFARAELGLSYATAGLAELTGDTTMIQRAIAHCERAVELISRQDAPLEWATAQNALGETLTTLAGSDKGARRRALTAYGQALEIFTLGVNPIERQRALVNVGELHMGQEEWAAALHAYEGAIEAGERVLAAAYTDDGRRDAAGAISPAYTRAAYCALRLAQYSLGLELLDRGKARILSERLRLFPAQLARLPNELRIRLEETQAEVLALESRTSPAGTPGISAAADAVAQLADVSERLMGEIAEAQRAGVQLLPVGLSATQIMALVPAGGALVAPLLTSRGAMVLVVPHGQHPTRDHVVELDSLTDSVVDQVLQGDAATPGWMEAYRRSRERAEQKDIDGWEASVLWVTEMLWRELVGPIDTALRELEVPAGAPILMLTQGKLAVLPLHAASRIVEGVRRPFAEDWVVSYSPGAAPLDAVFTRLRSRPATEPDLLAVSDPAANLAFATLEVKAIERHFADDHRIVLGHKTATHESVVASARKCTHLHFACHAAFNRADPMASALQLAGPELLTVGEVFDALTLDRTSLTVLSACETGVVDLERAPDEAVGFAAAFVDAGSTGVISTLWAVDDVSTAILMERFYTLYLDHGIPAPNALGQATGWLRGATTAELEVAEWWERAHEMTGSEAACVRAEYYRQTPDRKPFEAPHHWAAYLHTGPAARADGRGQLRQGAAEVPRDPAATP